MPQAVTHFLVAAIVVNLIRDYLVKDKKSFPLHLVLIGGLAGLLPDFDIAVFWVMGFFGFVSSEVHRTLSHTIWVPLLFFILSFVFWKNKSRSISKYRLTWSNVFFVLGVGCFIHILLDGIVVGSVIPFYPFIGLVVGLNLAGYLPLHIQSALTPSLDALLLMLWMIYIELKHKISNFI